MIPPPPPRILSHPSIYGWSALQSSWQGEFRATFWKKKSRNTTHYVINKIYIHVKTDQIKIQPFKEGQITKGQSWNFWEWAGKSEGQFYLLCVCVFVIENGVHFKGDFYLFAFFSSKSFVRFLFPLCQLFFLFIQLTFSKYCCIMSHFIFYFIGQSFAYLQTLHFPITLFDFFNAL